MSAMLLLLVYRPVRQSPAALQRTVRRQEEDAGEEEDSEPDVQRVVRVRPAGCGLLHAGVGGLGRRWGRAPATRRPAAVRRLRLGPRHPQRGDRAPGARRRRARRRRRRGGCAASLERRGQLAEKTGGRVAPPAAVTRRTTHDARPSQFRHRPRIM